MVVVVELLHPPIQLSSDEETTAEEVLRYVEGPVLAAVASVGLGT